MKAAKGLVFLTFSLWLIYSPFYVNADIESNKLVLSAKYSLINSAHQLPSDISHINPQSIIHVIILGLAWPFIMLLFLITFLQILVKFSSSQHRGWFFLILPVHAFYCDQGYICNLIETGCFVRFLGRLTGFSPRSKVIYFLRPWNYLTENCLVLFMLNCRFVLIFLF